MTSLPVGAVKRRRNSAGLGSLFVERSRMDAKQEPGKGGESADPSRPRRRCPLCDTKLAHTYTKQFCQACFMKLIQEQSGGLKEEIMSAVKQEMAETIKSIREAFTAAVAPPADAMEAGTSTATPLTPDPKAVTTQPEQPDKHKSKASSKRRIISSSEEEGIDEEDEDNDGSDASSVKSMDSMSDPKKVSRFRFPADDTEQLILAINKTLNIEPEKTKDISVHDRLYQGMEPAEPLTFPIHISTKNTIMSQWKYPDKKLFMSKGFIKRFPFKEDDVKMWNRCPKLDAAFSQVNKQNELAFEDLGYLKDPQDKKVEFALKKAWSSAGANFRPAAATTCVARVLALWVKKVEENVQKGASKEDILESLDVVSRATDYITDAAAENIRINARTTALINTARRNLWIKNWEGSQTSKARVCNIPFDGELLFGAQLDEILERTSNKKKSFPVKKKFVQNKRFFRRNRQENKERPQQRRKPWAINKEGAKKNFLFRSSDVQERK
ncbi:lamina-associated polypeptide 2, isoforms alpha/zeta-like [Hyperolius riggenbachi]|uniref:lamina-associated polypeptide 2, isoforms alpha/zeta-like n=1 Tax=Hyperolius riggenbachi TaxID=752182 RepID=UPI0035A3875C